MILQYSKDSRFLNWKLYDTQEHIDNIKKLPLKQFKNSNRYVLSLGVDYSYSNQTTTAISFDAYPPIKDLMDELNSELKTNFNSCLINYYPKGKTTGIGLHSDNEQELNSSIVASVSLGCDCEFTFVNSTERVHVTLTDGDIFIMGINCQKYYKHEIRYKKMPQDRISLTFREFKV